jgi:RES domain-containing protein
VSPRLRVWVAPTLLVHLHTPDLLNRYVLFEVRCDDSLITTLDPRKLPKSWKRSPAPASTQHLGDAWIAAAASPLLRVPSAIIPTEWNYLLNPAHPDLPKIRIGPRHPLKFDPRLLKN